MTSPAVAAAFERVPRECFLPEVAAEEGLEAVYRNEAIVTRRDTRGMPVSSSSQPSIMAAMLGALTLEPGHRVLEVGTGTGYNAALLACVVGPSGRVVSVELDPKLAARASDMLRVGGYRVEVHVGDGRDGWPGGGPYDRIVVTASGPDVPRAWFDQLADGGLVVVPLWLRDSLQRVVVLRRVSDGFESVEIIHGGFMALRGRLAEEPPVLHDQLSATDLVNPETRRPLVSLSGRALRRLQPSERRRLLALALGPPRAVPLAVPATPDVNLFVTLAAEDDRLIEWYAGSPDGGGVGVVGRAGESLAVLGPGPVVDHLDAWGEVDAEVVLAGIVGRWEEQGRPGRERLRVRVSYDVRPVGQERSRSGGSLLSFDWI